MTNFAVFRIAPMTGADVSGARSHQLREKKEAHIDASRTHLNRVLVGSGDPKADIFGHISAQNLSGKVPKKVAAEMILTAKNEWFSQKKDGKTVDVDAWAKANIDALQKKYGANLVSASLHLDEQTPHIHAFVVPISTHEIATGRGGKAKKTVTRLSYFREFGDDYDLISTARETGNTELLKLGKLQTWYAEAMQSAGFALERGIRGSRARHKSIKEFQKALAALEVEPPKPTFRPVAMPESVKKMGIDTGLFDAKSVSDFGDKVARSAFADGWSAHHSAVASGVAGKVLTERVRALEATLRQKEKAELFLHKELAMTQGKAAAAERDAKALAALMRGMPAGEMLSRMGYLFDLVSDGWITERGCVTVARDGKIHVENLAANERQPRNAIDLVMALRGVDYAGALGVLKQEIGEDAAHGIAVAVAAAAAAPSPLPAPHADSWWVVKKYLVETRKIPASMVDDLHKMGVIYSDQNNNCCFSLGRSGVELRGTRGSFHGTRGQKEFFALPSPAAKAVVYVESAIEALTYRAVYGEGFAVFSTGGENKDRLIEHAKAAQSKGFQIVAAFNADEKGAKYVADLRGAGVAVETHAPPAKDWNAALQAGAAMPPPPSPSRAPKTAPKLA